MTSRGGAPTATPGEGSSGPGRSVLEGAFSLLEALAVVGEAGLSDLAMRSGLPKATAHRMLSQLARLGVVEHRAGHYRMGATVTRLGRSWRTHRLLGKAAALPLRRLAAATRAGAAVVAPCAGAMVVVAGLPGAADAIFPHTVGTVLPPGSAAEIVVAASATASPPPPGYSTANWTRRLSSAREHGVVVQRHESEALFCVAAPVRAWSRVVVAAVAVTVLDSRRLDATADAVKHTARLVSGNLARMPAARQQL
ncbi:helix-turn-helix domain-containing protein [Streptomyces noboritoensis]|uniref:Helix-turn-helix domain-containing protein n=1 Tax=Streptomyces noboritoensis TaxID=67337 RepID=A0ABV6TFP3_9ACTN